MSEYIYGGKTITEGAAKGETRLERREEIVRCRDCKRRGYDEYDNSYCYQWDLPVTPDGFCAWGERKES